MIVKTKHKGAIQALSDSVYPGTYRIEKDIIFIGRSSSSDIVVNDKKVSRSHARITYSNGTYIIEDLNSKNGTYVNGSRIRGARQLNPGDIVKIGNSEFTFNIDVKSKRAISNNKPLLAAAVAIFIVIIAVTIPTILYMNRVSYKTVDRYWEGEKIYSYAIPSNFEDYWDTVPVIMPDYFFDSSRTKLGMFFFDQSEKISDEELIEAGRYTEENFEFYDELSNNLINFRVEKDSWFAKTNPNINAYVVMWEGTTGFTDIGGRSLWESKDSLIFVVYMSMEFNDDFSGNLILCDTAFDENGDKDIINNFIDSLDIDI